MRTRVALLLTILASLIWVGVLSLWIGRYALSSPTFYLHWLREGNVVARFTVALANEIPRQIPESNWWPWLPRSPEEIAGAFDYALSMTDVEGALARTAPAWASWMLGDVPSPPAVTPSVAGYLRGPRGDSLRDYLWRILPVCDEAAPPACRPRDSETYRAALDQQRVWWDDFVVAFITLLGQTESQLVGVWSGWPGSARWLWYLPVAAFALMAIAAFVMPAGRTRWATLSVPLLTGGVIVGGAGVLARLDTIPPPALLATAGTPWANIGVAIFPALWRAALQTIGSLWITGGLCSFALGMAFALLIFEGGWHKFFSIIVALAALLGVLWLYPASSLAPLAPRTVLSPEPTSTPLPTVTPTPIPPTATPTPVVDYWPVQAGTPVPTPSGMFGPAAQKLGCYQAAEAAVAAVRVADGRILALGPSTTSQRRLPALDGDARISNAMPVETFALSPSGDEIAVAGGLDLYVYALPDWTRVLRSRASTFSRIRALAYAGGKAYIVLGLDNGFLWVTEPATGRIVWLLSTNARPITALAAHPAKPLVLSGADDGKVRLWDLTAGESRAILQGHDAAILYLAFAPHGELALSVDVDGLWTLWDLGGPRILQQRRVVADDTITALSWPDSGIIAGTSGGDLIFVTDAFDTAVLHVSETAVTALSVAAPGYILTGSASGRVCVWGTLDR